MREDGDPGTVDTMRHRTVPTRAIGAGQVVVAHPEHGTPVVLGPTASLLWHELELWRTQEQLRDALSAAYPQVAVEERTNAVSGVIAELGEQGLLERRR